MSRSHDDEAVAVEGWCGPAGDGDTERWTLERRQMDGGDVQVIVTPIDDSDGGGWAVRVGYLDQLLASELSVEPDRASALAAAASYFEAVGTSPPVSPTRAGLTGDDSP